MASPELDPSSGVPLYRQIMGILRAEIVEGRIAADEPMTEERLLARFGVSRAPIRQALNELVSEGFVYRKQGRGTFPVTGVRVDRPADLKPGDLYRFLEEQGLHPTSRVSGLERVRPPEPLASRLGVADDELLLHFERIIEVNGEPFAENDIYIRAPRDFAPSEAELSDGGSAFSLLERAYGIAIERAEHEAWATAATPDRAGELGVAPGDPLLVIDTVFYATGGVTAGWRSAVHRADEFKFRFVSS